MENERGSDGAKEEVRKRLKSQGIEHRNIGMMEEWNDGKRRRKKR